MAVLSVDLRYRPLRAAMLVRRGCFEDLRRAIRLNSQLWGGAFNPIIPVDETAAPESRDQLERLVRRFHPDLLVPVASARCLRDARDAFPWLAEPFPSPAPQTLDKDELPRLQLLDVGHAIQGAWWDLIHRNSGVSPVMLPEIDPADSLADVHAVQFGDLTDGWLRDEYQKELYASPTKLGSDPLPVRLAKQFSPIDLTGVGLEPISVPLHARCVVVCVRGPVFEDLIVAWNLRATGCRVAVAAMSSEEAHTPFVKAAVERWTANSWHSRVFGGRPVVCIPKGEVGPGDQQDYAARLTGEQDPPVVMEYSDIECGYLPEPAEFACEPKSALAHWESADGPRTQIVVSLVAKPCEEERSNAAHMDHMAVQVEAEPLGRESLSLPSVPELNGPLNISMGWGCSTRTTPAGTSVIVSRANTEAVLVPRSHRELISETLRHCGIEASASDAAARTERMIAQLGGLGGCRVLLVRGVRKLLEATAVRKGAPPTVIKNHIADRVRGVASFERFTGQFRVDPTEELSVEGVCRFLIDRGVLQPGFSCQCPRCGLRDWLLLDRAAAIVPCTHCGKAFPLASQLMGNWPVSLRLGGLFANTEEQQGGVPVILAVMKTLDLLMRATSLSWCLQTDMRHQDGQAEADFVAMRLNRHRRPEFLLCEAKTRAEVTAAELERLVDVRRRIVEQGFAAVILIAKAVDELSEGEVELFRRQRAAGIPLAVFTLLELEESWRYGLDAKRSLELPSPHGSGLDDLVANSDYLHLRA